MEIHFLDVGFGNMTLLCFPNGLTYLYDCNITDENEDQVLDYLTKAMGTRNKIDVFVCSHRDADHIRGIGIIHGLFPIGEIGDAGVPGTTTDCAEYKEYMDLRRLLPYKKITGQTRRDVGEACVRFMNAEDPNMSDANDQSIVLKVEYKGSSALLAGDTSFKPWKEKILLCYTEKDLRTDILLAAHHGSNTFFDDPNDTKNYYTHHIQAMKPDMTLVSRTSTPCHPTACSTLRYQ